MRSSSRARDPGSLAKRPCRALQPPVKAGGINARIDRGLVLQVLEPLLFPGTPYLQDH